MFLDPQVLYIHSLASIRTKLSQISSFVLILAKLNNMPTNLKTQTNQPSFNQFFSKVVSSTTLCPISGIQEPMQTLSTHGIFLFSSCLGLSREKYVNLGGIMDFADILQSIKNEKSVEYLKFRVALDSRRTVWQAFDTFSHLPGQTSLRSSNFGNDGWHVCR